jgi:EmrB/QacA subfamily drug resistance transporter
MPASAWSKAGRSALTRRHSAEVTLPEDRTPPPSAPPALTVARRRWIMTAAMMAMFMAAVESTIVSTAMPTIVATLGDFHLLSWVFAAYLLTQAVTIPVYGRLADLYGRKRVLIIGSGVFLAGSALCGFAWSMPALIVFRGLQGLGAGAIMPVATTIVGDIYSPTERGRVQGAISSLWGVAAVTGPLLGAFLVQQVGWPTVFWVNLPIGIASVLVLALALREQRPPRPHSVDYLGSLLLMTASSALILALVQAGRLGASTVIALLGLATVALLLLLRHERRHPEPMMPLELWRLRIIVAVNTGAFAIGAVMMATVVFVPTYVQGVMGRSAVVAGFALTAMSMGWPLGSTLAGRLVNRSTYRAMAVAGGVGLVLGAALLVAMDPARGPLWAGSAAFLTGLGLGFSNTCVILAAQSSVPFRQRGIATSMGLFMRMLGQSVGAAIFGGILNLGLARRLPGAGDVVERLMEPSQRAGLGADTVARLTQAVAAALHQVYLVTGLLALVALALALLFPAGISPHHGRED